MSSAETFLLSGISSRALSAGREAVTRLDGGIEHRFRYGLRCPQHEQPAEQPGGEEGADELGGDEGRGSEGAMPAKLAERARATVTAGLAKLVELVNQ